MYILRTMTTYVEARIHPTLSSILPPVTSDKNAATHRRDTIVTFTDDSYKSFELTIVF